MSRLTGRRRNKLLRFRDAAYVYIKKNGPSSTAELMYNLSLVLSEKWIPKNANIAGQMMRRDGRFASREAKQSYLSRSTWTLVREWYIHEE